MSHAESVGCCERCGRKLYGQLGVGSTVIGGVAVVIVREASPRNWICCDACAVTICHACCRKPESGYCDACLSRITSAETRG